MLEKPIFFLYRSIPKSLGNWRKSLRIKAPFLLPARGKAAAAISPSPLNLIVWDELEGEGEEEEEEDCTQPGAEVSPKGVVEGCDFWTLEK